MKKKILIAIGILLGLVVLGNLFGDSSETSTDTQEIADTTQTGETEAPIDSFTLGAYKGLPGMPRVYLEIEAETDCQKLQEQFDQAYENHQRDDRRGRLDLMKISTSYMEVADERMKEIGCYDN